MWEHNKTCLKKGDLLLPLPSSIEGWEDNMKLWPRVTYSSIFSYFVDSVASDGEAMNNLKGSEAYQYLHSNKVGRVLHKLVGDFIYMKAEVEPSQSSGIPHHQAWVLIAQETGDIQTAGCSCIAGPGRSCSHAGAILWKVENAVRQGKTGMACTDVQRQWNAGTKKNAGQRKIKHISFKHHKPQHTYSNPTTSCDSATSPQLFRNHAEFKAYVDSSVMAPLFQLQTSKPSSLQLCYRANVESEASQSQTDLPFDPQMLHTAHGTELTCQKCILFYNAYVKLTPKQAEKLAQETQMQSESQMWHDARKLRLTASTAKKVPKRSTTDPGKFLKEHLYPTFKGNSATKYGQENEEKVIRLMEERGRAVERKGLVVHPDHSWLGASPDGILDSTQLLEVKCPLKNSTSLAEFLSRPQGDIRSMDDGQFVILPNGQSGYYQQVQLTMVCLGLQSCKLVIWTPSEDLELEVTFDEAYAQAQVQHLQSFYFAHMLPRLADDVIARNIRLCPKYQQLLKSQL